MLQLFKDQQPRSLLFLALLMFVTRMPLLVLQSPLPGDVSQITSYLPDILILLISSIIIFAQALWINFIFTEAQLIDKRTMVPAAVWIVITLLDKGFMVPGQPMLIGLFITALMHTLMDIRQQEASSKQCYHGGFLLGLAIAMHPPFVIFIPLLLMSLYNLKAFGLRAYAIAFMGIATPMIWAWGVFYINGNSFSWLQELLNSLAPLYFDYSIYLLAAIAIVILYAIGGSFALLGVLQSAGFKRKKNVKTIFYLAGGLGLVFGFSKDWIFTNVYFLLIPLSMLISTLLLRINKKLIADLLFGIFVISLLTIQILSSVI